MLTLEQMSQKLCSGAQALPFLVLQVVLTYTGGETTARVLVAIVPIFQVFMQVDFQFVI